MTKTRLPRRAAFGALTAAALLLCPAAMQVAFAQAWPTAKPITLVVGYPPGGSTDLTARTLGAELSRREVSAATRRVAHHQRDGFGRGPGLGECDLHGCRGKQQSGCGNSAYCGAAG